MAREVVGTRLRYARKSLRKLTQQRLAELSGVGQAIISETETGETKSPSGPHLSALAHALQVNSQWLAHGKLPMEASVATIPPPVDLSPEAIKVAQNWAKLSPEVGKRIADMIEEMVKVSTADRAPTRDAVTVKRTRKTTP
jgi:transcriptional regulator with XRE-family HTH domain